MRKTNLIFALLCATVVYTNIASAMERDDCPKKFLSNFVKEIENPEKLEENIDGLDEAIERLELLKTKQYVKEDFYQETKKLIATIETHLSSYISQLEAIEKKLIKETDALKRRAAKQSLE